MLDSILNTIKQMLGIATDDTSFDVDIVTNINSCFMVLNQLGIGPETVFSITDNSTEWTAFITDPVVYNSVKTYIYLKVRLLFDPPSSSFVLNAIQSDIQQYEWRLAAQVPIPPDPVIPEEI